MSSKSVVIDLPNLLELVDLNLTLLGLDQTERAIVSDVLMYAELRGKSQGLMKIIEKTVAPALDRTTLKIESKSPAIHLVHGNGNPGMVVLRTATDVTIDACKSLGLALTGTVGTSSSTGSIGYYASRIATAGYIGIVMAGSPKVMAVSGSLKRALGTNPLAIAVPTGTTPLVLDMATSATTWFDLIRCKHQGEPIPEGVALDATGNPTRDAARALEGVMQTFAGTKGSGLALMIELLTGPLMGAAIVDDSYDSRGNFVLAINPRLLAEDFVERADAILAAIRNGPVSPGVSQIRLAGEHGRQLATEQSEHGTIRVDTAVLAELRARADSNGTQA